MFKWKEGDGKLSLFGQNEYFYGLLTMLPHRHVTSKVDANKVNSQEK
jgi:hypothetical protein